MPKGKLSVTVVSASGLRNKDKVGKSDPYVRLWLDGKDDKSVRTVTKVGTLDPKWDQTFEFQVDRENKLRFKIWDSDAPEAEHKDELLAEGVVKLDKVFETKHHEETYELTHNMGFSSDGKITLRLDFTPDK